MIDDQGCDDSGCVVMSDEQDLIIGRPEVGHSTSFSLLLIFFLFFIKYIYLIDLYFRQYTSMVWRDGDLALDLRAQNVNSFGSETT